MNCTNRMASRLEGNTGNYAVGESVTDKGNVFGLVNAVLFLVTAQPKTKSTISFLQLLCFVTANVLNTSTAF